MQQPQGVQPVAQVRRAVHEDVPALPGRLPLDRQVGREELSSGQRHRQRLGPGQQRSRRHAAASFLSISPSQRVKPAVQGRGATLRPLFGTVLPRGS